MNKKRPDCLCLHGEFNAFCAETAKQSYKTKKNKDQRKMKMKRTE